MNDFDCLLSLCPFQRVGPQKTWQRSQAVPVVDFNDREDISKFVFSVSLLKLLANPQLRHQQSHYSYQDPAGGPRWLSQSEGFCQFDYKLWNNWQHWHESGKQLGSMWDNDAESMLRWKWVSRRIDAVIGISMGGSREVNPPPPPPSLPVSISCCGFDGTVRPTAALLTHTHTHLPGHQYYMSEGQESGDCWTGGDVML